MAYIDATLLNDIQETSATNEKRFSELGIVNAVKESTRAVDYIPPSAKEALSRVSSLQNVQIPVIKDQTVVVNATPGFNNIPNNLIDTDKYQFVAYDVFSGFRHYPSAYANNMVDQQYAVQQTMKNVLYQMGNTVEGILSTNLEARKTQLLNHTVQVSQGDGTFSFDTTPDVLNVSKSAQKETMFYNLEALMGANELEGQYRIVTNRAGLAVQKAEAMKFGAGNDKNLQALGFYGADRMHETGNLTAGAGEVFNGYLLRDGSIGVYENFPYDFRNGTEIAGKKWSISDIELPFARMRANVYVNTEATDATSLISSGTDSNLIMTHFEEMAIWFRFYVVYEYNSDLTTRANPIVKVKGLTT